MGFCDFSRFNKGEKEMDNVDYKGRKNVCKLAISQLKRSKFEVEKRMRWFKKLGEPIKKELKELFELTEEQKKYERELDG